MSWVFTFVAAILGMVAGTLGMFAIANACVQWYQISSFEGGSGYFVVGLSLLGAIGGFVLAIIAARLACAFVGPQWYSQIGGSLAIVSIALLIVAAISYGGMDRVPELDGKGIESVWEIRLPVEGNSEDAPARDPRDWPEEELRLELVSVSNHKPRGFRRAEFDRDAFRQEDGQWIIVARVPLFTSKGEFCVNLTLGGRDDGFWPAMRPVAAPGYFQWSAWTRTNKSGNQADDRAAVMYRFKHEKVDE
jgi:hypothetical protein